MSRKIILLLLVLVFTALPQEVKLNRYGLPVVDDPGVYLALIDEDESKLLVDLEEYIPGIILDIRYAGRNNFYGQAVYQSEKAFLRKDAAGGILKAQQELKQLGIGFKIFDAYRPYAVTVLFYEKIRDTNFVASAWTGSRHNRGCAVDLTLVDLKTGLELEMPTEYDDFTEKAASDYMNVSSTKKSNRELLHKVMQKYGFQPLKSEWWHFDYRDWKKYELTDIEFDVLEKIYSERKEVYENAR